MSAFVIREDPQLQGRRWLVAELARETNFLEVKAGSVRSDLVGSTAEMSINLWASRSTSCQTEPLEAAILSELSAGAWGHPEFGGDNKVQSQLKDVQQYVQI